MADEETQPPSFDIPERPERRYPRRGGVEYDGETVFTLSPEAAFDDGELVDLLEGVIEAGPYRYGDWFDLPMPVYLVHDDETGDTFRVSVRDGVVEFHVLPATEPAGLRALYGRISGSTDCIWSVTCRTG